MRGTSISVVLCVLVNVCSSHWFEKYNMIDYLPKYTNAFKYPTRKSDKNVCNSVWDYDTIDWNENCYYNPDADLTVPQIIKRHGYPVEIHNVVTRDGYYLQLFRIPHGRDNNDEQNKQAVFLQHGILSSSAPWVIVGNRSLGFYLADRGYDVWLSNSRGTTYSRGHTTFVQNSPKYWDWSWSDMAMYDLPDSLDYVISKNGRNDTIYVGQSLGTNLPYVYGTEEPEEAEKRLALIINLAPTLFMGGMKTDFRFWTPYEKKIQEYANSFGFYEFLPQTTEFRIMLEKLCLISSKQFINCIKTIFSIFGPDYKQFIPETLTVIIAHYPAGTSLKNFLHVAQSVNTDKFCPYDYGKLKNYEVYGMEFPPSYNLSKMTIPSFTMYSENDYTGTASGAIRLHESLPEETRVGLFRVRNKQFNHVDFIYAKDIVTEIFEEMLKVMENFK